MTDDLSPSDYSELIEYLGEKEKVEGAGLDRRRVDHTTSTDLYLGFTCSPAGIDLWKLHEEFDVDVVFSWHIPHKDRLDMGLRLRQ